MIPSSARSTSRATSIPVAPASSCAEAFMPGDVDQTRLDRVTQGERANPKSIVMPRRFSSSQRSVSTPVRAFTRAVLPCRCDRRCRLRSGGGTGVRVAGGGHPTRDAPEVQAESEAGLVEVVADKSGDEAAVSRGMRRTSAGAPPGVVQGQQVAGTPGRQPAGRLGRRRAQRGQNTPPSATLNNTGASPPGSIAASSRTHAVSDGSKPSTDTSRHSARTPLASTRSGAPPRAHRARL